MRRRCPKCGLPVKDANLGDHVARLHPEIPRRRYQELQIRAPRRGPSLRARWVAYGAVLVPVFVGVGLFVATLPAGGLGRLSASHDYYDFGSVPQSVVEHAFTLTNAGEGDLSILGVWTSCGCTSAHVVIAGVQSPHFGMHDNPAWTGKVAPGASASLVVLYDAIEHPDFYVGERSVFVRTDDPGNPEFEFRIRVNEG